MRIGGYELWEPVKGLCKSKAIWAREKGTNKYFPVCYFRKPKWMTDEQFKNIVNRFENIVMPEEL